MSDSDIPLRLAAQAAMREIEDMHPDSSLSANDVRRMFGAFSDQLKWVDIYPEKVEQAKTQLTGLAPCHKCGAEVPLGDGRDLAGLEDRKAGTFVRGCKKCYDEMQAPKAKEWKQLDADEHNCPVAYFMGWIACAYRFGHKHVYEDLKENWGKTCLNMAHAFRNNYRRSSDPHAKNLPWEERVEAKVVQSDPDFNVDKPLVYSERGEVWMMGPNESKARHDRPHVQNDKHCIVYPKCRPMTREEAFRPGAIARWRDTSVPGEYVQGYVQSRFTGSRCENTFIRGKYRKVDECVLVMPAQEDK